jgi:hypothetical protein
VIYVESGIELDLARCPGHVKHDAVNRVWPGVDFLIEEPAACIWLESPKLDPALRLHANDRMKQLIPSHGPRNQPWRHGVTVAVMNTEDWNRLYPEYPARAI